MALVCLASGYSLHCFSQSRPDTVLLPEITIVDSDPAKYHPGGKQEIYRTDSVTLLNLAQSIENHAPVYFIQYGAPGQVSSINLRGLGAYRTSVRWQGMEINSFTLGQTDFSEIAAGAGDQIRIQYGGTSSIYGNGALGGAVMLEDDLRYNLGQSFSINSILGSYGYAGVDLNYRYSGKRISSSTKLYRRQADNDFEYQLGSVTYEQQNAGFRHYGWLQDLEYKIDQRQLIALHFWYNDHFREIQPNQHDFNSHEELDTENTRISLKWQRTGDHWFSQAQAGFTNDYQLYDNSEITRLYRWFGSLETEWNGVKHLTVSLGANLNYLKPDVDAYQGHSKEIRSEIYTAATWSRIRNLTVGVSLRAPMRDGAFKTATPMFSGKCLIHQWSSLNLSADLQFGSSYRLPTMNDLHWQPGGNPDLKPETSRNLELGADLTFQKESIQWTLGLRGFRHMVEDWIIWIPGGRGEDADGQFISFWYPENIREVLAYGIEYQTDLYWKLPVKHLSTSLNISGTYNKAINRIPLSPADRSKDKQLPYTPLNVINGNWKWVYGSWHIGVTAQYRGLRYVETNNELPPLAAYTLWNFAAGKTGSLGAIDWSLQLVMNNATDEQYETYENRAMPGRNYQLNMIFKYNQ